MRRIVAVLIVTLCVFCVACQQKEGNSGNNTNNSQNTFDNVIPFDVSVFEYTLSQNSNWDTKAIVRTKSELDTFNNEYTLGSYVEKYDEQYFLNKSLLLCLFSKSHLEVSFSVEAVQCLDENITVTILDDTSNGKYYAQVLAFWICIIEVETADIKDASKIYFNFIKEN